MVPLPNIFTAKKRAETPRERLNGWILIFAEIDSIFLLPFFASFQHRAITQKADPKTIERELASRENCMLLWMNDFLIFLQALAA